MSDLERWYRRLLRAYPARYRADRGDEIIGTLLEAAPADRERPRLREAAALVAGGAQARAAQNQRLSAPANLRLAAILGVAIFLGFAETGRAAIAASSPLSILPTSERLNGTPGHPVVAAALALTAITLIWFSPRYVAAPALGLAAAVSLQPLRPPGIALAIVLALLALLAAVSRQRPPRSWLWWLAVLPAWAVLGVLETKGPMLASAFALAPVPIIFLAAAVLWIVVDGRIALACAVVVTLYGLLVRGALTGPAVWALLTIIALLALAAVLRMRRQAVL